MDNGSTDDTLAIARNLEASSNCIRVFTQDNQGPAGSRSTGLHMATGNLIAYCDSDDWVSTEWLPHLYQNLQTYQADISCCRAIIEGKPVAYDPSEVLEWNNDQAIGQFIDHQKLNGCLWNKLIRRELFDGIDFSRDMWYWEDLYVVWKVLKRAKKVVRCNEGTYHFTVHPESMCAQKVSENRLMCTFKVWDMIVDDCRTMPAYQHHLPAAEATRRNWAISELKSIYRTSQRFPQYEHRIQQVVRQGGFRSICASQGLANKAFSLCAATSLGITRCLVAIAK